MKISIAFYKGKGGRLHNIIRWWTKSIYSHAELILPDQTWISISPLYNSKIESKRKLLVDNLQWDFVPLDIDSEQLQTILDFFKETEGCGYDWVGMELSQFLPFHIKRKGKWYCSEWIAYALRIACVVDWKIIKIYDRADLSPGVLHNIVEKVNSDKAKKIQS